MEVADVVLINKEDTVSTQDLQHMKVCLGPKPFTLNPFKHLQTVKDLRVKGLGLRFG